MQLNPRPNVSREGSDRKGQNPELEEIPRAPIAPDANSAQSTTNLTANLTPVMVQEGGKEQGHEDEENEANDAIDARIASSRRRLTSNSCLFCPHQSTSIELSMEHMTRQHSFFIPDTDYLRDLEGLLLYLGEKVAVGNVCLFCNGRSREFRTMEAVWKHMTDKSHCKIAYGTQKDRLEISDFYDFSSSYPAPTNQASKVQKVSGMVSTRELEESGSDDDWEDVEEDDDSEPADKESSSEEETLPRGQITYGDTEFELVLPSGARIGHRSLKRYYNQSFSSFGSSTEDPKSGAAIVRRLLTDKRSDLIPVKGGFGAFGSGTQVIKARNRGEAREAGRHIREFRDQKRKEDYKTRVAFVHNHQKHYRDPLLQVSFILNNRPFIELMCDVSDQCVRKFIITSISPFHYLYQYITVPRINFVGGR